MNYPTQTSLREYNSYTMLNARSVAASAWHLARVVSNAEDNVAKVTYNTGNFTYTCIAAIATPLSAAEWQVRRLEDDGSGNTRQMWCDGDDKFDNVATSLAVVSGLTYL